MPTIDRIKNTVLNLNIEQLIHLRDVGLDMILNDTDKSVADFTIGQKDELVIIINDRITELQV